MGDTAAVRLFQRLRQRMRDVEYLPNGNGALAR